jgi:hypothetical protein
MKIHFYILKCSAKFINARSNGRAMLGCKCTFQIFLTIISTLKICALKFFVNETVEKIIIWKLLDVVGPTMLGSFN